MEPPRVVRRVRRSTAAVAVLAVIAATGACGGAPRGSPEPPLVVAVTAGASEWAAQLPRAVRDELVERASASRQPGGATVALLVAGQSPVTYDLTPMRGERVENAGRRRDTKVKDNIAAFESAVAAAAASEPGLDLLGLLDRAGREHEQARIVALSSGVSTSPPLDLRQGWPDGGQEVLDNLESMESLPQYLAGREVTFYYLGDTAGTQPELPVKLRKDLREVYLEVCRAAAAARCEAQDDPPSEQPPLSTAGVPVVEIPQVAPPRPGPTACEQVVAVPAVLLFEPNSPALAPDADAVLSPFADQIRSGSGAMTISQISGHTADLDPGDGLRLSEQRAQAVAERLVRLGVPASAITEVVGRGETEPVAPNRNPDGSPSASARDNRRVEITTMTTNCPTGRTQ